MEFRHLECFKVLAEELHFRRAARRLYIAQPPLSRLIKKLEDELGVRLFDRNNRYVRLTPCGEYFRDEVVRLFAGLEAAKNHLTHMKEGLSGELRIGFVESFMQSWLPAILAEFRLRQPHVRTILAALPNSAQIEALRIGMIDLGFVRSPVVSVGLNAKLIFRDSFSAILPPGCILAGDGDIRIDKLAGEPFIGLDKESGFQLPETVHRICLSAGFSPEVVQTASTVSSVLRLVEAGLGWSIIPSSTLGAYQSRIRIIRLDDCPERSDLFILSGSDNRSKAADDFLDMVESMDLADLNIASFPLPAPAGPSSAG